MADETAGADAVPSDTAPRAGTPWLLGLGLVLVAFNMRTAVTGLSPVLTEVMRETGLSPLAASVLTTVPTFCFGIGAFLAPRFVARAGLDRLVLLMLVLLALGCALRGIAAIPTLFIGQLLACLSIGILNVLLPSVVKRDFGAHAASITGLYSMMFAVGAAAAAATTAPIQLALHGSWAGALALWGAPAALAALVWAVHAQRRPADAKTARHGVRGLWTDPLAWQLTLFMGLQSALAYIVFGWLVPMLRDRGFDPVDAGLVLSVSVVAQAVGALAAPYLATRGRDQRLANGVAVMLGCAGLMGCAFAPGPGVWVSSAVLGFAQGGMIALALTSMVLRSRDNHIAAHLSGMCQSVGYTFASGGPFLVGVLHARTGGWTAAMIFAGVLSAVMLPCAIGAGRNIYVRASSTA